MIQVVAFPRDDNPYQDHLAAALNGQGVTVRYLPWPTRSHTINLLLLPIQLLRARLGGARILHLHWVYPFVLPGVPAKAGRRLAGAWYTVFLETARLVGLRIVWTAHNVLPHQRVFTDDVGRRQQLIDRADAIIAHSIHTEDALRGRGLRPGRIVLAPHGPYGGYHDRLIDPVEARGRLGLPPHAPTVLYFGRINAYKGVTDLLDSWAVVRQAVPGAVLVIAGACANTALRQEIEDQSRAQGGSVHLLLRLIPDELIPVLFSAADLACLPFRQVTTSGSAVLAAGLVRLLIPDLTMLRDVPGAHVERYTPGRDEPGRSIARQLVDPPPANRPDPAVFPGWDVSAKAHATLFHRLLAAPATTDSRPKGTDVASA